MLIGLDLDDTIYKERDYVASGRRAVVRAVAIDTGLPEERIVAAMESGEDAFDSLEAYLKDEGIGGWNVGRMVAVYRNHTPELEPDKHVNEILERLRKCGHRIVIITDGTTVRQRAKIEALGLGNAVDAVIVSEEAGGGKITGRPFEMATKLFPEPQRIYIGDNATKDFVYANRNGWATVRLADSEGVNIHPQPEMLPVPDYEARMTVFSLAGYLETLATKSCYINGKNNN